MSDSREDSPDWLRSFQTPAQSAIPLSSGSESPLSDSPRRDEEDEINLCKLFKKEDRLVPQIKDNDEESLVSEPVKGKSPNDNEKTKLTPGRKRKSKDDGEKQGKASKRKISKKPVHSLEQNHYILTLSSDSESSRDTIPIRTGDRQLSAHDEGQCTENKKDMDDIVLDDDGKSSINDASKVKSPKKLLRKEDAKPMKKKNTNGIISGENGGNVDVVKEDISEKCPGPQVSSSRLPLVLSEKVQRSKALIECEGDSIDLSGDVGAVGRLVISDVPSTNHEMLLDLKGTVYKTTIVPSRTFCVVSFGPSEAKIEAIMNDFIQLKPQSNVYEAETMVEGTLDGFSFDSEDEADNLLKATAQADQQETAEEQPMGRTKRKTEKTSGAVAKKGKAAGGKPPKKVKKKPQVSKKSKTKK
ncbi:DNA-binding protein BIN4 [Abeliophyllum distichum]|uniref:DNA-binding protein BIN4 n=1 Tax=Abeliophyllum distichum TaxID=126358 RepID=A0ABD1W0E5_9LAMI